MHIITQQIIEVFQEERDLDRALQMKNYMRGKFEYFGLNAALRRDLSKIYLAEISKEGRQIVYQIIRELWQQEFRELHYFGQELFFKVAEDMLEESDLALINQMITSNAWWDTVDFIASKICKIYFDKFPENRDNWIDHCVRSKDIWLQRSSLLLHLKQKKEIDFDCMFAVILRLSHTNEFFLNKAIGWLLREYSKNHPQLIENFIENNEAALSKLSIREGSKYL